ncbi:MAG TPA: DUF1674 domain-containing protein [Parvibaculum sp.]
MSEECVSEDAEKPVAEKVLSEAAKRALAEAEARRKVADAAASAHPRPREINGPKGVEAGAEPTRYGDWEVKGIVSDF